MSEMNRRKEFAINTFEYWFGFSLGGLICILPSSMFGVSNSDIWHKAIAWVTWQCIPWAILMAVWSDRKKIKNAKKFAELARKRSRGELSADEFIEAVKGFDVDDVAKGSQMLVDAGEVWITRAKDLEMKRG